MLYLAKQADPSFTFDDHVTAAAMPAVRRAQTACLAEVEHAVMDVRLTACTAFWGVSIRCSAGITQLMDYEMDYDTLKLEAQVFMGAGGQDTTVSPDKQERLAKDACTAGSTIEFHVYPDLDHSGTVNGSLADSTPFVKKAFAGEAIAGNCGQ